MLHVTGKRELFNKHNASGENFMFKTPYGWILVIIIVAFIVYVSAYELCVCVYVPACRYANGTVHVWRS